MRTSSDRNMMINSPGETDLFIVNTHRVSIMKKSQVDTHMSDLKSRNLRCRALESNARIVLSKPSFSPILIMTATLLLSYQTISLVEADLPTVIVRGFGNYRTTVEGTVLLFTPDSASGVDGPTNIRATQLSLQPTSIRPTSVQAMSIEQSTRSEQPNLSHRASGSESVEPQESWHQHRPTPPLDLVSRPNGFSQNGFVPANDRIELDESEGKHSTPSVQSEEAISPISDGIRARSGDKATVISSSNLQNDKLIQNPNNGWLARRPSRGSLKPHANPLSIGGHGVRRPALTLTSGESALDRSKSGPAADPGAAIALNSSFQSRLANASAKLRNRFKKPPISSSANLSLTQSTTLKPPVSSPISVTSKEREIEVNAERSEESKVEEIHQPVGPNQTTPKVGSEEILTALNQQQSANKPEWRTGDQEKGQTQQLGELHSGTLAAGSLELPNGQIANSPPMNFDSFFQGGEPVSTESSADISGRTQASANKQGLIAPSFTSDIPSGAPLSSSAQPIESQSINKSLELTESTISMQTVTKTYSTIMTSTKTRLAPFQVKSSTGVHTITEQYVITKMLTAYQTMPVGEFLLPDSLNTRAPFELFNVASETSRDSQEQPITIPANYVNSGDLGTPVQQEQPISKNPANWLHDFSNTDSLLGLPQVPSTTGNQDPLTAILEQQQSQLEAGQKLALSNLLANEPLDQLGSSLDPTALLAAANSDPSGDSINIPDLNNPLILAAAIQNPQLAAVILAAQQLKLKQQRNKLIAGSQQLGPTAAIQPSFSTTFSTTIKPSTYTARDTMYTTRLVSFKDGRTVRTRTVSEPGSVIEQILTTMATEVTPITITIRPTAPIAAPLATQSSGLSNPNTANTLKNALIATQLANLLARRQQQIGLQPSTMSPITSDSQANQIAALQQLLANQQRQQAAKYQPNLQQLLQSMQQPQAAATASSQPTSSPKATDDKIRSQGDVNATPALPSIPAAPLATTLTSLHVRTYTVHNAFKTIYRTITSTELITSTLFPAKATQLAG